MYRENRNYLFSFNLSLKIDGPDVDKSFYPIKMCHLFLGQLWPMGPMIIVFWGVLYLPIDYKKKRPK